jgi:hypothetical protein
MTRSSPVRPPCRCTNVRTEGPLGAIVAAALTLIAAVVPAVAGQGDTGVDLSYAAPVLPPSAATGKPRVAPAGPVEPEPGSCIPALPCGTRLYGTLRRNGAVELQVPAWRW